MSKHLTWCLKRTFLFANRLNLTRQFTPSRKTSNYGVEKYTTMREINVDYEEPKSFGEFAEDAKSGRLLAIDTLTKLLAITKASALKTVDQYPAFKQLPKKMIYDNFQCLREAGVYKSNIKDNKFLLTDTTRDLKEKIAIVKKLDLDINDAVHLFHLTIHVLASFEKRSRIEASYLPTSNRIQYLAEKLKTEVGKMCHLMSYYPHMLSIPAPKLLTITELLLEAGIPPENIVTDLYSYTYSITTIKLKIERARSIGLQPIRPWVLRCSEIVWEKAEQRQSQRTVILKPNQSIQEYLCEIFDCDLESVNFVISKNASILNIRMDKIVGIARLLKREGYGIEDIQRTPRIVHRSYATLKELFEVYKKLGCRRPQLFKFLLCKEKFVNSLSLRSTLSRKKKSS